MPGRYEQPTPPSRAKALLNRLKRLIWKEPGPAEDPYSYVTAPKKPRPPHLSATAVAELED